MYNFNMEGIGSNVKLGKAGARIKDAGGSSASIRTNDDSNLATLSVATPTAPDHAVSKKFLETRSDVRVTTDIDGSGDPLANQADGLVAIVTTTGGGYTANEIYYGAASAWEAITRTAGLTIKVSQDLAGADASFTAEHIYMWDTTSSDWIDLGASADTSGQIRVHTFEVEHDDAASVDVITIPGGSTILKAIVEVTEVFDGSGYFELTLEDGTTKVIALAEYDEAALGTYVIDGIQELLAADNTLKALVTTGTSTTGIASVMLHYSLI